MKILLITHRFYPNVGGTEANAEFLAQAFHDNGYTVHVLTWTSEIGKKQFPFSVFRNPGLSVLLTEHRWADVVFENSPVLRLSWPALFFRKPSVVALNTWINNEDGTKSLAARMKYLWMKRASAVIAVSKALAKKCWPDAKVIENAYNEKLFQSNTPWVERKKTFVFLGRLVSDKGADMAVELVDRLKSFTDISLTVIGDGEEREKLMTWVKDNGLDEIVAFTGSLTGQTLVDTLNKHKYMLIPSRWEEPFGIVALEGMGAGCIPIVSNGGGLPEAVGDAGLVFTRGDKENMLAVIKNVLTNEQLQRDLRSAAVTQLRLHTRAAVASRYITIINTALKNNI